MPRWSDSLHKKRLSNAPYGSPLSILFIPLHRLDGVGIGYDKTVKSEVYAMSLWKDARSPALKTEEAALLTAMPRPMAGGAALKTVLQAARKMENMQVSEVQTHSGQRESRAQTGRTASFTRVPRNRAALRQVWNRP